MKHLVPYRCRFFFCTSPRTELISLLRCFLRVLDVLIYFLPHTRFLPMYGPWEFPPWLQLWSHLSFQLCICSPPKNRNILITQIELNHLPSMPDFICPTASRTLLAPAASENMCIYSTVILFIIYLSWNVNLTFCSWIGQI